MGGKILLDKTTTVKDILWNQKKREKIVWQKGKLE